MKYKFVAAYCIYGMAMPQELTDVRVYQSSDVHVFLTSDATDQLAILDRQAAIGTLMLSARLGAAIDGDN